MSGRPAAPALPRVAFTLTGIAQIAFGLLLALIVGTVVGWGLHWISDASNLLSAFLRAIAWTAATLVCWEVASILGKWLLIGRVKPGEMKLWGPRYLRLWAAALLVRTAPAARLLGSEWQRWHLIACGARIGGGTLMLCPTPPVPDLLRIGPGAVIGERTLLAGYRPAPGALVFDRISIGDGAVLGDDCVLEPGSAVGGQGRLAPSSSLQPGQQVPPGESWHGSPARLVDAELPPLPQLITASRIPQPVRRAGHAVGRMVSWLIGLAIAATAISLLGGHLFTDLLPTSTGSFAVAGELAGAAGIALLVVLGGLVGAVTLAASPRLLSGLLTDSRSFPVPSWRWALARSAAAGIGQHWLNELLGGSTLTRAHLARIGWQLRHRPGRIESFGHLPGQASPLGVVVGAGTIVGDRLRVANLEHSADSFRFRPATIGANSSIGDQVTWPGAARLGDDCLLAARTAVPLTGPIRSGIGLQGSPAVEMPRRNAEQPALFDPLADPGPALAQRVNYDRASLTLRLLVSAIWLTLLLAAVQVLILTPWPNWLVTTAILLSAILLRWVCRLAAEGLARLATQSRPVAFSILDPRFGRHQRVRKLGLDPPAILNGTPLRPLWWRLRGADIGRCVFDDGAQLSEPSLVTIGDQVCLGAGSAIQSHQAQDAFYSMAAVFVGDQSVIGNRALLLGGTQLGIQTHVGADSVVFAETGEAASSWLGNPAVLVDSGPVGSLAAPAPNQAPARPRPTKPTRSPKPSPVEVAEDPAPVPVPVPTRVEPADSVEPAAPAANTGSATAASADPRETFPLVGTSFRAQRCLLPELQTAIAVLDLTGTPLRDLNLPQALAGFGIPEECLEDDLSLRDAPITTGQEIRSLLARVLLRQLLSADHPRYQPKEWGFIRSSAGGLRPFWPTTEESVSLGRSEAIVVAAVASGPLGVAVVAELTDPKPEPSAAQWLSRDEWTWLARLPRSEARSSLARMAALKKAALKAVSEVAPAKVNELDTLSARDSVIWHPAAQTPTRLLATAWPVPAGGVQHWIAVVRPVGGVLTDDNQGGIRDGQH